MRGNIGGTGGGVYLQNASDDAQLVGIDAGDGGVSDNTAEDLSGGVVLFDGAGWSGGTIRDNHAPLCAGIAAFDDEAFVDATIADTTVTGNVATEEGGGLCVDGQPTVLTNVALTGNEAPLGGAGSIDAPTAWAGGGITRNRSTTGGAIWRTEGTFTATDLDFGAGDSDNAPADVAFEAGE